jgi:hypothetical protein
MKIMLFATATVVVVIGITLSLGLGVLWLVGAGGVADPLLTLAAAPY